MEGFLWNLWKAFLLGVVQIEGISKRIPSQKEGIWRIPQGFLLGGFQSEGTAKGMHNLAHHESDIIKGRSIRIRFVSLHTISNYLGNIAVFFKYWHFLISSWRGSFFQYSPLLFGKFTMTFPLTKSAIKNIQVIGITKFKGNHCSILFRNFIFRVLSPRPASREGESVKYPVLNSSSDWLSS